MAASVWSGYLTFGLISMPVRLFSGARGSRIGFHMLHREDNTRIKQQLYCPTDERVVGRDEIVKGYEYRKGEYVIIEPDDLKRASCLACQQGVTVTEQRVHSIRWRTLYPPTEGP